MGQKRGLNRPNSTINYQIPPIAPKVEKSEYGDLILRYLYSIGVEFIFGVPGGAIEPLYNAMARSERANGVKSVVACHESSAAFMADGYARESKKLGVCCATTGPGATNLITGVACAAADNIPLLVITAQTAIPSFGRYGLQESSCTGINTVAMFEHCTRYNTLVSHTEQLERKLQTAIYHAFGPSPGPVHLSIPLDILRTPWDSPPIDHSNTAGGDGQGLSMIPNYYRNQLPDDIEMNKLADAILRNAGVTLVIGESCDESAQIILELAQLKGWSVITTPMARGLVPSYHPCYCGVFGMSGHQYAQEVLSDKKNNTIVYIGGNLDEIATAGWDENGLFSSRLIHIDDNPKHLAQSTIAQMQVYGSPRKIFKWLLEKCHSMTLAQTDSSIKRDFPIYITKEEQNKCTSNPGDDQRPIRPQYLIRELSLRCPSDTRVAADSGASYMWTIHYWEFLPSKGLERNLFRAGMGFSSMGWAIGACIGLAKANPTNPVVCLTGDGSLLMSGQDITTAQSENVNVLFIVLNDSSLGLVKHGQKLAGAEPIGFKLLPINFSNVAHAMGIEAYRIESKSDFDNLDLNAILNKPGPCLLDIIIDDTEVPPMGLRMKALGTVDDEEEDY